MPCLCVSEIAARLGSVWSGDPAAEVSGIAALADAESEHLSFYADPRYRAAALRTRAAAVLVKSGDTTLPSERTLPVADPHRAVQQVLAWLSPEPELRPGIHPTALISSSAEVHSSARIDAFASVGARCVIGPHVHLEAGARVADDVQVRDGSIIGANAVLMNGVRIGRRTRIGPGTVIGGIGFGFVQVGDTSRRVPHVGTVIVGDDVEIGANCTVDRATLGATKIGRGSKLDNLVHVGHNVVIGANVLIAAQCGLSGSATLGDGVAMGGQAGVAGHIVVAPGTRIAAKAGVMKSYRRRRSHVSRDEGSCEATANKRGDEVVTLAGHPARPLMEQRRAEAALLHLDDLRRRVKELERLLAGLDARSGRT